MPNYRRAYVPGGTFFLTLVTHRRARLFDRADARLALHRAVEDTRRRRPFGLVAVVLLPDHLHLILTLPVGDADFSTRVAAIKAGLTRRWLAGAEGGGLKRALPGAGGVPDSGAVPDAVGRVPTRHARERSQSTGRERKGYRGVWQARFWEHHVRDADDLIGCCDYVHYNPVKHGYATCPHAWPYSSFARFVARHDYPPDWLCVCDRGPAPVSTPRDIAGCEMDL